MGQSPFAKKSLFSQGPRNQRRSTRLDLEVPIILSGRDALGQSFREETVTRIVNLHGAKVRTSRPVLVGMMVTVENIRSGQGGKAICVQVYEALPGEATHDIAVQLVHPGNMWGVENPPADWELVAAELGGRRIAVPDQGSAPAVATPRTLAGAPPSPPRAPEAAPAVLSAQLAGLEKRAAEIVGAAAESLRARADEVVSEGQRDFHQQLEVMVKEARERATQGMEETYAQLSSAIEILRGEALTEIDRVAAQNFEKKLDALVSGAENEMQGRAEKATADLRAALETFRSEAMGEVAREAVTSIEQRLAELSNENEKRIAQRIDQAFAELEAALVTFRADLGDELAARQQQALQSTEQALRARVAAMVSAFLAPAGEAPATPQVNPAAKK
ncbi:MAG: hypothetical protein LAN62_00880 [Acidobacteriia bacterium]|nr:hypothetical protein [Terriglobia bacterium]